MIEKKILLKNKMINGINSEKRHKKIFDPNDILLWGLKMALEVTKK